MAKKKFPRGSEEWMLFMDYWNLFQELGEVEVTEAYWEGALKKVDEFREKYKGPMEQFAASISTALLCELKRRCPEWR